ncbi:unnamed protein product [Gordionus sp. m RMFG-2023]
MWPINNTASLGTQNFNSNQDWASLAQQWVKQKEDINPLNQYFQTRMAMINNPNLPNFYPSNNYFPANQNFQPHMSYQNPIFQQNTQMYQPNSNNNNQNMINNDFEYGSSNNWGQSYPNKFMPRQPLMPYNFHNENKTYQNFNPQMMPNTNIMNYNNPNIPHQQFPQNRSQFNPRLNFILNNVQAMNDQNFSTIPNQLNINPTLPNIEDSTLQIRKDLFNENPKENDLHAYKSVSNTSQLSQFNSEYIAYNSIPINAMIGAQQTDIQIDYQNINKRKSLPAWLKEGLEKMEKEKERKPQDNTYQLKNTDLIIDEKESHVEYNPQLLNEETDNFNAMETLLGESPLEPAESSPNNDEVKSNDYTSAIHPSINLVTKIKLVLTEVLITSTNELIADVVNNEMTLIRAESISQYGSGEDSSQSENEENTEKSSQLLAEEIKDEFMIPLPADRGIKRILNADETTSRKIVGNIDPGDREGGIRRSNSNIKPDVPKTHESEHRVPSKATTLSKEAKPDAKSNSLIKEMVKTNQKILSTSKSTKHSHRGDEDNLKKRESSTHLNKSSFSDEQKNKTKSSSSKKVAESKSPKMAEGKNGKDNKIDKVGKNDIIMKPSSTDVKMGKARVEEPKIKNVKVKETFVEKGNKEKEAKDKRAAMGGNVLKNDEGKKDKKSPKIINSKSVKVDEIRDVKSENKVPKRKDKDPEIIMLAKKICSKKQEILTKSHEKPVDLISVKKVKINKKKKEKGDKKHRKHVKSSKEARQSKKSRKSKKSKKSSSLSSSSSSTDSSTSSDSS